MTKRQEARLITIIKVDIWKIKKKIRHKKNNLFDKKDLKKQMEMLNSIAGKKLRSIMLNKTQLDYFETETSPKKLEYVLSQIAQAIMWEIATSKEVLDCISNLKYADNTPLRKEDILSFKRSISKAFGLEYNPNAFDKEKQIAYYRGEIAKALDIEEEEIIYILDDIKKMCEYDSVLGAISNCSYVGSLPKYDRKKSYIERKKFEKIKEKTIEGLKFLKLPYENVEQKQYKKGEDWDWMYYDKTLKHIKKTLYNELTLMCGTGKDRAKNITKIIDYM